MCSYTYLIAIRTDMQAACYFQLLIIMDVNFTQCFDRLHEHHAQRGAQHFALHCVSLTSKIHNLLQQQMFVVWSYLVDYQNFRIIYKFSLRPKII